MMVEQSVAMSVASDPCFTFLWVSAVSVLCQCCSITAAVTVTL